MAPMAPLGREAAMKCVEERKLPIGFGSPHPTVCILEQDGKLRIRELVIDEAESRAAFEKARATGSSFMPEHHYALGKPAGKIYAEASTHEELLAIMKTMKWPSHW